MARTLDPGKLAVETFPTTSAAAVATKAECTFACDTNYDCSTVCIVPTNVSSPC